MMKNGLSIALWATNLALPVKDMNDWAALVEAQAAQAAEKGASVLLMPEYMAEQWLHFAPKNLAPTQQLYWLADLTDKALEKLKAVSKKHGILIAAGSVPVHAPGNTPPLHNRAHAVFPDGRVLMQDKLCLTPKEKNPDGWHLSPGSTLQIFEWEGYRIAMLICLDIELPALSARLAGEDIDLILVPSMTKKLAGYHRVFDCAKARAVELQTAVAVVGCIASAPPREANISGASIFLPCEEQFGHTGIAAKIDPVYKTDGPGPLLIHVVPLGEIRKMRQGSAEVWPGSWTAGHVKVTSC